MGLLLLLLLLLMLMLQLVAEVAMHIRSGHSHCLGMFGSKIDATTGAPHHHEE